MKCWTNSNFPFLTAFIVDEIQKKKATQISYRRELFRNESFLLNEDMACWRPAVATKKTFEWQLRRKRKTRKKGVRLRSTNQSEKWTGNVEIGCRQDGRRQTLYNKLSLSIKNRHVTWQWFHGYMEATTPDGRPFSLVLKKEILRTYVFFLGGLF